MRRVCRAPGRGSAAGDVLRDLVDAALQEGLVSVEAPGTDGWGRVAGLRARLRPGGPLQPWRVDEDPDTAVLLDAAGAPVPPADAVAALGLTGAGAARLGTDVALAHEHAASLRAGRAALTAAEATPPPGGDLLAGERLAATRGRPFHPTGRAVAGWTGDELADLGPMRTAPLPVAWAAVRRDRLRLGPVAGSGSLEDVLLDDGDRARLDDALRRAGLDPAEHQPLPVHPWQAERVLPAAFADEIARGEVTPLALRAGALHPTSSLRTLVVARPDTVGPAHHLKLPLGVTTLGAARLLPPRYLDNGDRAERTVRAVLAGDPALRALVALCAEGRWAGWSRGDDEFDDRPGQLAAQVRAYPPADDDAVLVPMGALAAHEWDVLGPALGVDDPVAFFGALADSFTAVLLGFLAHGVLPEVHGQNVVVGVAPGGRVTGYVLRDHDTLRIHAPWAAAAGVADPGYRIRPGGRQSLRLDAAADLVGYAQTLGLQVNLYGIADALARHHGLPETELWARVREAVERAPATVDLPRDVAVVVEEALLRAPRWPSRTVLGPLLATGPSSSVSMPAGVGQVPNPLRTGDEQHALERARAGARERLLNAVLREVGPRPPGPGPVRLPGPGAALVAVIERWSPSGHHRWADEVAVEDERGRRRAGHDEVVDRLLVIVDALAPDTPRDAGAADRRAALARQVERSVERTARYLAAPARPEPADARGRTRHAEQSLRRGHPFHPAPKSLGGDGATALDAAALDAVSPELGASFRLHHLALDPAVTLGERVGPGEWLPDDVVAATPTGMLALPVHPLQAAHLRTLPALERLRASGALVDLGPLGREVYATSSVRTVCDPGFATAWKLPLHVRITNFVRTVPPEHARRSADAGRAVLALRGGWAFDGFAVLVETGWRGVDPAVVGDDVAADATVLFRENPFAHAGCADLAPRVVAGLVEEGPRGEPPPLVDEVRRSGLTPDAWLRAYLAISLLPLLAIFGGHGIGFEAHPQNSLLHTDGGRPTRFWVRDLEGAHVSRERRPAVVAPDSPLVYGEAQAWQRTRYHAVVNHLTTVVAALAHHLDEVRDEAALWAVVAATLAEDAGDAAAPYARDLLDAPTLPAKANLVSRFTGRGEDPLYVELPNPIRMAAP